MPAAPNHIRDKASSDHAWDKRFTKDIPISDASNMMLFSEPVLYR